MNRCHTHRLLLACLILFLSAGASTAAELRIPVIAYDQNQIALSGIVFTYRGIETEATVDSGLTEVVLVLTPDIDLSPGSALELGLPGSLAKTWFLIDDTIHIPRPGEQGAEVVLMRKADMRRLAGEVRDTPPSADREPSAAEEQQRRLEVARGFGLSSEEELAAAIRAFKESAEAADDPMDEGVAHFLAREYAQAEPFFRSALEQAEEREEEAQDAIVESARYLGQTLYEQGKYYDAVDAFRKAFARRPEDTELMSWLAGLLDEVAAFAASCVGDRRVELRCGPSQRG